MSTITLYFKKIIRQLAFGEQFCLEAVVTCCVLLVALFSSTRVLTRLGFWIYDLISRLQDKPSSKTAINNVDEDHEKLLETRWDEEQGYERCRLQNSFIETESSSSSSDESE